jgi:hypothetical protein
VSARSVLAISLAVACSRGDAIAQPETAEPATPEVAPDATPEPTPAPTPAPMPEPTPEPAPPAPAAEPQPASPSRSIDDAEGMTTEALLAAHGKPDATKGERWIYRYPRDGGCVDREIVYTLQVREGVVTAVDRTTQQTGRHCEPMGSP